MEVTALNALAVAVVVLLFTVTGGIIYLTAAEWRDRRRQEREKREKRGR
ncbi:MAG: hypothetical protein ACRDB1_14485 [Microcoleaceae cyanobacterium]